MKVDGVLEKIPLEFTNFSPYDSWEDCLQMATDIEDFHRCTFGDDVFKST